ncbi:MAG: sigma-70 family RNA polymerase sigma factor [Spirochaetota bacterium]|nr:sigma-70 family RNA polymerase sigma factor [Spirochaetota bacterium]
MSKGTNKKQSHQEDRKLVEDFQANINSAFDKLVIKYKNIVFNLCYRILGDHDEANDCAQDTFVKVYKNLKNYQFRSSFSTWLYTIAVNTCKNRLSSLDYRFNKRMARIDHPGNAENRQQKIEILDLSFNPDQIFERREKARLIEEAIDSLPLKQRVMIVLRDIEGKSYEEIASITGYKPGTVKSRLARARQHLRDRLRGII